MQPGETVTPGPAPVPEQPQQPQIPEQAPLQPPVQQVPEPQPQEPVEAPAAEWQFSDDNTAPDTEQAPELPTEAVSWTASEYISHVKGPSWFIALGFALAVLSIAIYFLTKDILTIVAVVVAGLSFAVFAGRKPQVLNYAIDAQGIHIGTKLYQFGDFKSFDVTEEGSLPAIQLVPLKRFLPPITVFYDQAQEDVILDIVEAYLPQEDHNPDMIDRFTKGIRF